jgi:hypothetical protein
VEGVAIYLEAHGGEWLADQSNSLVPSTCPGLVGRFGQPARLGSLDRRLELLDQSPS